MSTPTTIPLYYTAPNVNTSTNANIVPIAYGVIQYMNTSPYAYLTGAFNMFNPSYSSAGTPAQFDFDIVPPNTNTQVVVVATGIGGSGTSVNSSYCPIVRFVTNNNPTTNTITITISLCGGSGNNTWGMHVVVYGY